MPTATITSKGQTVIPKPIRVQLGLKPGDTIDFIIQENGDVLIRPSVQDVRKLKGVLHRPGQKPVSVKEMNLTKSCGQPSLRLSKRTSSGRRWEISLAAEPIWRTITLAMPTTITVRQPH